jgi:hypothetical protein
LGFIGGLSGFIPIWRTRTVNLGFEFSVMLTKTRHECFKVEFFKGQESVRERVWRSKTKLLDELKKSGAIQGKQRRGLGSAVRWPSECGGQLCIEIKNPVEWFWK